MLAFGVIAGGMMLWSYFFPNPGKGNVRFRLGFSLLVDGQPKSASSVMEVWYYGGGKNAMVGPGGTVGYAQLHGGTAPILDLGPRGMIAAAMAPDITEKGRRKREHNLSCTGGAYYAEFPGIFGLSPAQMAAAKSMKKELTEKFYPAFIWIPAGASYRQAQQICWEEIPKIVGSDVRFQSAWVELAPDAPLVKKLDISAPWLDELRKDQAEGRFISAPFQFKINRYSQLETELFK